MKRRSPLLTALALLVSFILCVLALLAVNVTLAIPRRAAQTFGLPSQNLSYPQKLYYAVLLLLEEDALTRPANPNGPAHPFVIGLGEPTASVIQRLHDEGLITSTEAFRTYLMYSGLDTSIQAGEYALSPSMNAIDLAHALQDATPARLSFRILPGWRLEEIAAALPFSGLNISPDEFLASARIPRSGFSFSDDLPPHASLEGFFYPTTYEITRTMNLESLIRIALDNFESHLTQDLRDGFTSHGLNIYEAVTLASIVQREAVQSDEMPMIASVFYNRLAAGLKLDSDPTAQYALGYNQEQNTWWTNPLSLTDLEINSPYNSYRYSGLPPGPIASPGIDALEAVANPASSPYYYFRAACDGSGRHLFAETFDEHVANACP